MKIITNAYRNKDGIVMIETFRINFDGTKCWFLNDKLHRTNGPAMEFVSGTKFWFLNDKRHRTDGPAVEWYDNYMTKWWYLSDIRYYSKQEYYDKLKEMK